MGDIVRKLLSNSFVLFVIFIVIAIIIPLPSWLLDFMILLNISLSLIILPEIYCDETPPGSV